MGQQQRKVFNKEKPSEGEKFFVPLPSDAMRYVHHDRMSADKFFLYQLIIDYYNPKEGCAYPSIETLSVRYGKTKDTTSKHLDDLKAVGLIDFPEKGLYIPLEPLPADDFFGEFPEAWQNYQRKLKDSETRRKEGKRRMAAWRQKKGYA